MLKQKITPKEATEIKKYFDECKNVVIVTHSSPDGDAIGSSLGLKEYLERKGKTVNVIVPNIFPDFLKWMHDAEKVVIFERQKALSYNLINMADLICCLDFNTLSRIDEVAIPVQKSVARKVLIDHHLEPDDFANLIISRPDCSSTCELVFRVIDKIGGMANLNLYGAEDLYAGMCTDTGGFTYNSNEPDIFMIIAELLRKGINKDVIYRKLFNTYTVDRYRLMGYILSEKLVQYPELHASYFAVSREELSRFNFLKGDMEGVVNMPLAIRGQKLSISLREDTEKPVVWVSVRSYDDFSARELAEKFFNGGGHFNAAGGHIDGNIDEAVEICKKAIEAYSEVLKA
ncbi:MAG: DHH family phosphoesterase [Bacteroidaceae bacterium]|nr:DHH family phosphoesterase [Bacteroidaceae bacterium]